MNDEIENQVDDQIVDDTPEVDYEKEASAQGWSPKEKWKGSENDWVDAKTFVERGRQILPILQKNNERLLRDLERTKSEMAELRSATIQFKEFQKQQAEKRETELKSQIARLREEKKQAISSGDGNLVVELDEQIDSLKEEQSQVKQKAQEEVQKEVQETAVAPELQDWIDNNTWYTTNMNMAAETNNIAARLRQSHPEYGWSQFLEALDEELEQTFNPEKLGRKSKPRTPVEGNKRGSASGSNKGKSYDDLPSDAKSACDMFVRQGLMKKEDYVREYFG